MAIHRVKRLTATRSVAEDTEVIAFGDLHGRSDLLDALVAVARDVPRAAGRREVVFLGDLIDRGPDGVGTVGRALGAREELGADVQVNLAGNHEMMLAVALEERLSVDVRARAAADHLDNGGRALARQAMEATGERDAERAMREAFGPYLSTLRHHHRSGDVLFVHAGVHPRIPLGEFLAAPLDALYGARLVDPDTHWAWVREPFLTRHVRRAEGHHGVFVVHGHSIVGVADFASDDQAVWDSRVNLDAGSFLTGLARMAVIRGDAIELHEVGV